MTVAEFKDRFREFAATKDASVSAKLAQAARSMDATVWGDHYDDGLGQKAAHLLALSPEGQQAGLRMGAGANQQTVYQGEFERLERIVGTSYRAELT